MKRCGWLVLSLWLAWSGYAQTTDEALRLVLSAEPATETEQQVQELLKEEGIHVVHFWSPHSHNAMAELGNGWHELIEINGDVTFIFITVFNDGDVSEATLRTHSIHARVHRFAQPDLGPSAIPANRRRAFLGLPLAWTPTTWIFHNRGQLAFALNYGEANQELLQQLLDNARANWSGR